ncbi:methylated-DNA--[protein]-cysteine S-methyltransferase [Odoribacter lunatus]|uniref:methylated-DNA--[protein]-cysteine S-methyltransferase n=1 Tax=Odoribacter lunatus TaxID=2941335 RepID=UPI00203A5095|nr:methylated-DNA--[protein]-cysteine S-methyltransferase [Odoribacter lunatus]
MEALYFYEGPIGKFGLQESNDVLTRIWVGTNISLIPEDYELRETPLLQEAYRQLDAYFKRELRRFDIPYHTEGTPFQQKVWQALADIPYGTTITYGELARRVGNTKACRAVGLANGRNPLPILLPCHRVIGSNGKLTGYTGGLHIKTTLLQIEGYELPVQSFRMI